MPDARPRPFTRTRPIQWFPIIGGVVIVAYSTARGFAENAWWFAMAAFLPASLLILQLYSRRRPRS